MNDRAEPRRGADHRVGTRAMRRLAFGVAMAGVAAAAPMPVLQRGIAAGGHLDAVTILESGSDGSLAYAAGTYAADNAGQKVDGRILLVLRRCGDAWLVVAHEVVVRDQP